jgi:hypothetical protein
MMRLAACSSISNPVVAFGKRAAKPLIDGYLLGKPTIVSDGLLRYPIVKQPGDRGDYSDYWVISAADGTSAYVKSSYRPECWGPLKSPVVIQTAPDGRRYISDLPSPEATIS